MSEDTALMTKEKKELPASEEKTVPGKFFIPPTDIYEKDDVLVMIMDVPGVQKQNLDIQLEKGILDIEARIDSNRYENLEPAYTEYNVGHFSRRFKLSNEIDQSSIDAHLENGVLTLKLPKIPEAAPRKIQIN